MSDLFSAAVRSGDWEFLSPVVMPFYQMQWYEENHETGHAILQFSRNVLAIHRLNGVINSSVGPAAFVESVDEAVQVLIELGAQYFAKLEALSNVKVDYFRKDVSIDPEISLIAKAELHEDLLPLSRDLLDCMSTVSRVGRGTAEASEVVNKIAALRTAAQIYLGRL